VRVDDRGGKTGLEEVGARCSDAFFGLASGWDSLGSMSWNSKDFGFIVLLLLGINVVVELDVFRLGRAVRDLDILDGARVPPRALIFLKHSALQGLEKPLQGPSWSQCSFSPDTRAVTFLVIRVGRDGLYVPISSGLGPLVSRISGPDSGRGLDSSRSVGGWRSGVVSSAPCPLAWE